MSHKDFDVTGFYYKKKGYSFRKYLNIKRKETNIVNPDLMVIMMNPGSSRPINEIYDKETIAIPDKTQNQIMKVMKECDLYYARILNLSDYIKPKSIEFYKKIDELNAHDIYHSIFHKSRKTDLKKLFVRECPVVFAWGVHYKLRELTKLAVDTLNVKNPIGLEKENNKYYHPLPRNYQKQKEWVEKITSQLKSK